MGLFGGFHKKTELEKDNQRPGVKKDNQCPDVNDNDDTSLSGSILKE